MAGTEMEVKESALIPLEDVKELLNILAIKAEHGNEVLGYT